MPDPLHHTRIMAAVAALIAETQNDGRPPLCIAVCDAAGDLLHYTRTAGAARRGTAIAKAKAHTAALLETPTSALHARLERECLTLADFCDAGLTSLAGGVPLTLNSRTLGGVGISGRRPDEDELLANRLAAALLRENTHTPA